MVLSFDSICKQWFQSWYFQDLKHFNMMTILLFVAGLICFWLFFKSIDWFEKI